MDDYAQWALDQAETLGAAYADVRVIDTRERYVSTKNGKVGQAAVGETLGLGIRVIAGGAWGFASTDSLTREKIEATAARAVSIARASAMVKKRDVELAPENKVTAVWDTPLEKDPFATTIDENIGLLLKVDAELRRVSGVTLAEAALHFRRQEQLFMSTLGSVSRQTRDLTGGGYAA